MSVFLLAGEDQYGNNFAPSLRIGSVGRLITPRSSCGLAVECGGDSDDEGINVAMAEETLVSYDNVISQIFMLLILS